MFPSKDDAPQMQQEVTMFDYTGPFKDSIDVAHHYGFHLVRPLDVSSNNHEDEEFFPDTYKKTCAERGKELTKCGPDLVCHTQNPRRKFGSLMLEAHGCTSSIAEGIVLKTALSILKNAGEKQLEVEINCLGDGDAQTRFRKHYNEFVKKHLSKIPDEYQADVRDNPYFASKLSMRDENLKAVFADAPGPLNYLSDSDRHHLMEVIEYLESMGVPYRLNPHLLGKGGTPSHSFFRIVRPLKQSKKSKKDGDHDISPTILASGERFDHRDGRASRKQPIVSLSIKLMAGKHESYKEKKQSETPRLYFVHIGPEAKRAGFKVLDILRETKLPVKQYLIRNSLSEQMASAESAQPSHILIMGLKEAQENSVIIRDTLTRAQHTIPIPQLKSFLRTTIR